MNESRYNILKRGLPRYQYGIPVWSKRISYGDELKALIKGIKPSRDDFDDSSPISPTPKTSVPKSGGVTAPQTN